MNPIELLSAPGFGILRSVLLVVLLLATLTDLHRRRIPNVLTFPTALLAFALHAGYGGLPVLIASVLAWLAWFALGFFFYRTLAGREIGAGDIKLVMATSACIGFLPAAYVTFVSLLLLLLWLFVRWIAQGTARANFSGLYSWLRGMATPGLQRIHFRPVGMVDRTPHAPFMLLGALVCYVLYRKGIFIR